ncbi:hypothetical protein BsWGS_16626 [Bradybaena similaris]
MQSSLYFISTTLLVSLVNGAFDQAFCSARIQNIEPGDDQGTKPAFYDNFYVFIEKKVSSAHSVIYEDEYFSMEAGIAYGTVRGPVNQTQTWVDTNTDEIIVGPLGTQVCTATTLNALNSERLIGVTVNAAGNVTLSTPDVALGWDTTSQKMIKNQGQGTARGITTNVWSVCTYNQATDVTAVSEWHIVDPSLTSMPEITKREVLKPILPVLVKVESIDHTVPNSPVNQTYRLDFTFFDHVQATDEIFQTPTTMLCSAKPSAQVPLPNSPSYFKFKGEQITITNINSQAASAPDLVYTVEEYSQLSQLFIQDFITKPDNVNSGNDKSYIRNIDDFTIGLTFQVNLISGSCLVTPISADNVDAISIAGGNVVMRTSQQFFDLDSDQYQYMGIHTKRGIACDAWSAYFTEGKSDHLQDTLYTWYFANAQWRKTYGFSSTVTFPVSLEIQQEDTFIQFNMYEFDTQDAIKLPDVSLCFQPNTTLNIDFHISASYTQMVAPNVQVFDKAIYDAVVLATSLSSVLRITELDVQPYSSSDIIVRFKLLDIASIKAAGDVSVAQHDAPNSQILADLCQAINSGTFFIDIVSSTDSGMVKRTVTAQANSCSQCSGSSSFTTPQQTAPSGSPPPASTASQSGSTIASQSYFSLQSGEYSAGSMGGMGVGMLALGLVLGVTVVFSLKKLRRPTSEAVYDMNKLEESQS